MDKPMQLISIIIPVYKAEKYLERCIDSVCQQTYQNLEIILVNDGSPDKSGEICDEYAAKDSRISVIHKENGGLSSARNCALDVANGEYISFVDSDDYIDKKMYERLYSLMVSFHAQISCCGIKNVNEEGKVLSLYNNDASKTVMAFSRYDAMMELINNRIITNSFCDKLFCAAIFKDIRFVEGMILEDMEAMPRCLAKTNQVIYTSEPFYNYVMTSDSILRSRFSIRQFDAMRASAQRIAFFERECPAGVNRAKSQHISICLDLIYRSYAAPDCDSKREEAIREVFRLRAEIGATGLRASTRVKIQLLRVGLPLYILTMKKYYGILNRFKAKGKPYKSDIVGDEDKR